MEHSVVIGGAGFIGSWVVDEILKDQNSRVTIVDNLISSETWNISASPRVNFIEGSASDINNLTIIKGKVDYVYQLACFHGNQSSIARPLDDLENGLKTTLTTLEWVKKNHQEARIIYSSAGCSIAEKTWNTPTPVEELEMTSLFHDSPYSISKITGEMYCNYYAKQQELDIVRVRFQNVYGPKEILGAGVWRGTVDSIWRNVIPTFIWKSLHNEPIEVFGNGSRDFIYIQDLVKGIQKARHFGKSGDVYNLATGTEVSIINLAKLIIDLTESRSNLVQRDSRVWDNSGRRLGSTYKSATEINFNAEIDIKSGILETIEWTLQNNDKIQSSINKFK